MECFRVFQHGLDVDRRAPSMARLGLDQQLAFVEAVMAEDAYVGDVVGRDRFIEQARYFATYFDGILVRPLALDSIPVGSDVTIVHAAFELEMTITLTTINKVFPHLHDKSCLKRKLLGHRMRCPAKSIFQFDEAQHVTSIEWTIDFVSGLLEFVTIEEAGIVLQNVRIVRDAYLLDAVNEILPPEQAPEKEEWNDDVESASIAH